MFILLANRDGVKSDLKINRALILAGFLTEEEEGRDGENGVRCRMWCGATGLTVGLHQKFEGGGGERINS